MAADTPPTGPGMLAARVRVPQHVVYRSFGTETVVLNVKTGKYHGLNPTAGRMLEVLQEEDSVSSAALRLAGEYGQPIEVIEQDVCGLCADLAGRGLIELDGGGS